MKNVRLQDEKEMNFVEEFPYLTKFIYVIDVMLYITIPA